MKKYLTCLSAFIVAITIFYPSLLRAQVQWLAPDDQAKQLKEELRLTDYQTREITSVLKKSREEVMTAILNNNGARDSVRSAIQDIQNKTTEKIKELITDQQAQKYDVLHLDALQLDTLQVDMLRHDALQQNAHPKENQVQIMEPKEESLKSLNFTFGGHSTLSTTGAMAGTTTGFGMSYFFKSDEALRIGIQIVYASQTVPSNMTGYSDGSQSLFQSGLSLDYLKYMLGATSRVHPYLGAGIAFSYTSTDQKFIAGSDQTQPETKNGLVSINNFNMQGGATFGVQGIGGVEFYIYPEISLSAEYDLNIINFNIPSNVTTTEGGVSYTTKNTTTTQILGFSAANLGLHIYF